MALRDPFAAAWKLWALAVLAMVLVPVACHEARAGDKPGDQAAEEIPGMLVFDCGALAESIAPFADFRDAGAPLERVIAMLRERVKGAPPQRIEVVLREIRRVWSEGLPREEAGYALFRRCEEQLGDMGRTT